MENKKVERLDDYDTKLANKKAKKAFSAILAGVVLVAGTVVGTAHFKKNSNKEVETTTTSTTQETTTSFEEIDALYLTEDFNINDASAVMERAKAIYEISEKQVKVNDIVNILYLVNEKFDAISYPENTKTDTEKFKYIQELITKKMYNLLNDNIELHSQRAEQLTNDLKKLVEVDSDVKYIYAYMFEAKHEGKNSAIKLAQIIEEQNDNIEEKNVDGFKKTADDMKQATEDLKKANLSDGYGVVDFLDTMSKEPLWPGFKFETDYVDSYSNSLFANWAKKEGIDYNELLKGKNCVAKSKEGVSYNSSDAQKANAKEKTTAKADIKKKGGKKVATSTSIVNNEFTTKVVKESSTVKVTEGTTVIKDNGTTAKVEITTDAKGNGHGEVVIPGGKVVEEVTEISGGEVIGEVTEISGGEVIGEETSEQNSSESEFSSTKDKNSTTTQKTASTTTTTTTTTTGFYDYTYVDKDIPDMDIYTENEFDNESQKAKASIGVGGAALGMLGLYSARLRRRKTLEEIEAAEASKSKKHR